MQLIDSLRERVRSVVLRMLPQGGIAERTVKSGIWLGATNIFDRGLQIILLIILANLLDPRDFGLMGITLLTLTALKRFSVLGLNDALIQRNDDDVDGFLDTAWTLKAFRGLVLAGILFLIAPLVSNVFNEPRTTDLLRAIAISPVLMGFRNPGVIYFRKDLDFHKQFVFKLSGSLVNFVVALAYAFIFADVWALIVGFVAADVTRTIVSYVIHTYRPKPSIDIDLFKELIDYGKWVSGSSILQFLHSEGDDAVIGWLLTASSLGLYQLAYRLSNAPATEITHVVTGVTFPTYSKLQDDIPRLREVFFKTVQLTTFISFPMAVGIMAIAPVFVQTFLGEKWLPMVTTMQILALYGFLRSLGATMGPVWRAVGRPDYLTKLQGLRVILMAVLIYPVTVRFGIEGVAGMIVAISIFPFMPLDTYLVVKSVETTFSRFLREIAYPTLASIFMGLGVLLAREYLIPGSGIIEFFLLLGIGIALYIIAVGGLTFTFDWDIKNNFKTIVSNL